MGRRLDTRIEKMVLLHDHAFVAFQTRSDKELSRLVTDVVERKDI